MSNIQIYNIKKLNIYKKTSNTNNGRMKNYTERKL